MNFNFKKLLGIKEKSFNNYGCGGIIQINPFRINDYKDLSPTDVKKCLNSIVSACIDKRANNTALSIPVVYKDVAGLDTRKNVPYDNHPFTELLNAPNPFQSRFEIMVQTVSNLDIWGNAYWYLPKNTFGVPTEIRLINPNSITYLFDSNNYPIGFKRTFYANNTKREIYYSLDDIIHFRYANYDVDSLIGLSVIQKAAPEILLHQDESNYQRGFLNNGGQPSLALETEAVLKPAEKEAIKNKFYQDHSGSKNAGKILLLDAGMKVRPYSLNPAELSYLESKKATRDNILAMFNVPIGMFFTENVNKANNESGLNNFLKNTIKEIITQIDSKLTSYIKRTYNKRFYIEHQLPYEYTREEQLKEITEIAKLGAISMNELRNFTNMNADPYLEKEDNKYYNIKFSTTNNSNSSDNNSTDTSDNNN